MQWPVFQEAEKKRGMSFCRTTVDFFKKAVYSKYKQDKNRKEIYEGNSEM